MKITVLGGASVRTPLLVRSLLLARDLPLAEIALFDTDGRKADLMMRVIDRVRERFSPSARITLPSTPVDALRGADFVFSSFRPGGDAARVLDERVPLLRGTLGQETVGAGGFSMALRSVPASLAYADLAAELCPSAWYVNFTNPSGIITEALLSHSRNRKVIGICDAPIAIQRIAASLYGVPVQEVQMRYFGLNHLGWAHSLRVSGVERLPELIAHRAEEFAAAEPLYRDLIPHMKETGLVPNEYLLFYLFHRRIAAALAFGGETRGEAVLKSNAALLAALADPSRDPVEAYEGYLQGREDGYMSKESGRTREASPVSLFVKKANLGYDDVAIMTMRSLMGLGAAELPLNVRNGGFCPWLREEDVIETTCAIGPDGPVPIGTAPDLPAGPRGLVASVKAYERGVATAASTGDRALAADALSANPLVGSSVGPELLRAMEAAHGDALAYLR